MIAHMNQTATFAQMVCEKEARAEAAEVLRVDPNFSVERYAKTAPVKGQAGIHKRVEDLEFGN